MTTVSIADIQVLPLEVKIADRIAESNGSIQFVSQLKYQSPQLTSPRPFESPPTSDTLTIIQYSPELGTLIGPSPTHSLLLSTLTTSKNPFFHEACVYLPRTDELYLTSNLLQSSSTSLYPTILISRLKLTRSPSSLQPNTIAKLDWAKLRPPPGIDMPNGGTAYREGILFCAQGSVVPGTGGIYYMPRTAPPQALVKGWYGREFNSVNDVVVTRDGGIWFTDPCYGFEQGFRRRPELPNQVYRFEPTTGECRVVAGEWERCCGICFSPDERRCYVTDTGMVHGDGTRDLMRPATIYVFDVVYEGGQPFLKGRRTFAFPTRGVPDGVRCDEHGNVYAGTGAGLEIWNEGGCLLGRIDVPGGKGIANFGFGKEGEIFLCGEQRLWVVQLDGGKVEERRRVEEEERRRVEREREEEAERRRVVEESEVD
ncbi:hypothetical protein HYFRA_00005206 [Hymenoscyphus fraxineus]|uniref:SMP-30/Gluconolactonase/LRE-like region domain-containing protein n=1 Tax=Hymenoscyphus fraxineus TaxID=746836 RepID=A0A9N9L9Z2_9HELO|nr:hypothetical protein HYFRA_00005206 [Hymenoscyphus fraxineus]